MPRRTPFLEMSQHRSPGITSIFNEIKNSRRNRILDLGPMTTGTFQFFSQQSCKIHFENLDEFILDHQQAPIHTQVEMLETFISHHDSKEKFDLILAWDLLNYLELPVVKKLFELLNPWCKSDTLLHCMRYMGHNVPATPRRFQVINKHYLQFDESPIAIRRIPYHQTSALLKHIPEYYMHSALIQVEGMYHGISEHVLRYMPEQRKKKMYTALAEIPQIGEELERKLDKHHNSPAIRHAIDYLNSKQDSRVLDLGPKINANLEVWRSYCNEVFNEDLNASIRWHQANAQEDTQKNAKVSSASLSMEALNFEPDIRFDAVILWDILNFCDRNLIRQIVSRLAEYCSPGCKLVVFTYIGNQIPQSAQTFFLHKDGDLKLNDAIQTSRVSAPMTSTMMMKLFPGLEVKQTYVYQDGMSTGICEFVFEIEALSGRHGLHDSASNSAPKPIPKLQRALSWI